MITGFQGFGMLRFAVLVTALLSLLPGCKSGVVSRLTKVNTDKYYAVKAEKTAFYKFGPHQGNGPDKELPKDTLVNLVRPSFGYSKVRIVPTGEQGYVVSEDLVTASPMLVATLTATPPPVAANTVAAPENFDLQSTDSTFVPPPDEALPAPDLPPAVAEPSPL